MADTIIQILISLLVILTPIGVILGIVLLVTASNQQDLIKKKKFKKWGVYSIILAPLLLFVVLSLWGLISIGYSTATGTSLKP